MIARATLAGVGAGLLCASLLAGCPIPGSVPIPGNPGSGTGTEPAASLAGYVYLDNAQQEYVLSARASSSLTAVRGAIVRVVDSQGIAHQTLTDSDGHWRFFGIPEGPVTVRISAANGTTITSRPAAVSSEETLLWPDPVVRVRVDPGSGSGDGATPTPATTPQPTQVRRLRITQWDGNFRLSSVPNAIGTQQTDGDTPPQTPLTALVTVEFYGEGPTARIVVRVQVHNAYEAWSVSTEVNEIDTDLVGYFESSAVNLVPGGYTTVFAGSLLNDTFRIGEMEEIVLPGVSFLRINAPGGIAGATAITGEVDAQTDGSRTLVGMFSGAVEL